MEEENPFYQYIWEHQKQYSVVIEATGWVVYAYMLFDKEIIADTWVGNQKMFDTTIDIEKWRGLAPPNEARFMLYPDEIIRNCEPEYVRWRVADGKIVEVSICFDTPDKTMIVMREDSSIGWSNKVKTDSPFAKKLIQ